MRRVLVLATVMAGLIGLAPAAAVDSGTPEPVEPTWTRVTDTDGRNIDEVGIARTTDGTLHVLWRKQAAPGQDEIRHTPISASGVVGATTTATSGFVSVGNPAVVVFPDGSMRIFFAGLTTSSGGRNGVQSAITSAGGEAGTWTLTGARVSSTQSAIPEGVGAAVKPDGTPAFVYAHTFVVGFHTGLDSSEADLNLVPGTKCCGYNPNAVFESNGNGYVAWYSNVDGEVGTYVQQVTPTLGDKQIVPESATDGRAVAPSQRTPIVARAGGGTYVAYCNGYPTCTRVMLWKVGSAAPITVATGTDIEAVTLAAAPDGRLWVLWEDAFAETLYASRSDESATEMGVPAPFTAPTGTDTVWKLTADATDDALDVLAAVTVRNGTTPELATWHTSVLPGLAVEVKSTKAKATYTVTDAGEPVSGVKIKAGKKTLTTNRQGVATGAKAPATVEVSKTGYATAVVSTAPMPTTTTTPPTTTSGSATTTTSTR